MGGFHKTNQKQKEIALRSGSIKTTQVKEVGEADALRHNDATLRRQIRRNTFLLAASMVALYAMGQLVLAVAALTFAALTAAGVAVNTIGLTGLSFAGALLSLIPVFGVLRHHRKQAAPLLE